MSSQTDRWCICLFRNIIALQYVFVNPFPRTVIQGKHLSFKHVLDFSDKQLESSIVLYLVRFSVLSLQAQFLTKSKVCWLFERRILRDINHLTFESPNHPDSSQCPQSHELRESCTLLTVFHVSIKLSQHRVFLAPTCILTPFAHYIKVSLFVLSILLGCVEINNIKTTV